LRLSRYTSLLASCATTLRYFWRFRPAKRLTELPLRLTGRRDANGGMCRRAAGISSIAARIFQGRICDSSCRKSSAPDPAWARGCSVMQSRSLGSRSISSMRCSKELKCHTIDKS